MDTTQHKTALVLGDAIIDAAHRDLFDGLKRLAACDEAAFAPACETLFAVLERDFRSEEDMMEDLGFAGLAAHREQHARVLGSLHHALAALDKGDSGPARQAVRLLMPWLELHIGTFDATMIAAAQLADAAAGKP